jgi:type IV pilus assembly protein PilA
MIRINDRLRRMREEGGFTLIELMVVVLIIAILIAIAIPTFLGARKRAQDRAAQSNLRNTVTAAKAIFTDKEDYSDATVAALTAGEPSLTFGTDDSDSADDVSVGSSATSGSGKHNRFIASSRSDSAVCWFVQDIVGPAGTANSGTTWEQVPDAADNACEAADAPVFGSALWKKKPGDTA